jgi:hypothetical protein
MLEAAMESRKEKANQKRREDFLKTAIFKTETHLLGKSEGGISGRF